MRSLRSRLSALWIMLAISGAATAYLLIESFRQSSDARVARAEDVVARGCRDIADRYQFFVSGWSGAPVDERLKQELVTLVQTTLAKAPGVEGGIWQTDGGSLAYAYPSYEGSGPKTDLPAAELNTIRQVNAEAAHSGRVAVSRQPGRSQTLIVHACPLQGPLQNATAWTMTRAMTAEGPAYTHLLVGLTVLALTLFGSALWLARVLYSWSRRIGMLEATLGRPDDLIDLPRLPHTGEQELDRLVDAVNEAGHRLAIERHRAATAERLAAVGRLSANLAHEIRNPIAAMRLKAENAVVSGDEARRTSALHAILQQIARIDALLSDLLDMTHAGEPKLRLVNLSAFLQATVEAHRDLAEQKGLSLRADTDQPADRSVQFDPAQVQRALDNLILNAIQNTPAGGEILVEAARQNDRLLFRVTDTGPGVSQDVRDRLFEPFVTTRAEGTGLGLAIVREIARAHHGEAQWTEVQSGTRFEMELPWRPS
ncbi:MAG: HAMP domain-containing sensor histidine kinase [Bradyrhizobium sp.]